MGRRYRLGIVYTDHVRLRLRTLWDAAVRIAYLALGSSGVRLRIDVPHQFAVARLHDEDDVPVPLQLPQTLDNARWARPKRLGHSGVRAPAGGGLRVERVGQ
jgi:hypothetical protein